MKNKSQKTLAVLISVMFLLVSVVSAFPPVVFADYEDGMDCPICGSNWSDTF